MTPKLRFPEFQGEWQARHGRDAFTSRRSRGRPGLPLYSVTLDQGMVRRDSLEREFASNATDESNLRAEKDDLVYNMMRMWQGAVGRAPEECIVSPAYVVLAAKAETSPRFFEYWFQRNRSIYWLWAYSHGLTSDRLRLYFRDFSQVPMSLPVRAEQERIAELLGALDQRIQLLRQRRVGLERYKRGVKQRLFSQTLRFKRGDGTAFPSWKGMRLGNVAELNPKSAQLPEVFEYIDLESVTNGRLAATQTVRRDDAPERAQRVVQRADILFQTVRPYQMNNLFFEHGDNYVASTGYAQIRAAINPRFLFQFLLTRPFVAEVIRRCTGTGYPAINSRDLAAIPVRVPHSDEQRLIADLLGALDDKITAVSGKIDAMQTFKDGLLQQMFV